MAGVVREAMPRTSDKPRGNKGKKVKYDRDSWDQLSNKVLKDAGRQHRRTGGAHKGDIVPALRPPPRRRICKTLYCKKEGCLLSYKERLAMRKNYKSMTAEGQRQYLSDCIERVEPGRRRPRGPSIRARKNSFRYAVIYKGTRHQMCKKGFMATLGDGDKRIEGIRTKAMSGKPNVFVEKRGKKKNRAGTITPALRLKVQLHIMSYPNEESHYTRNVGRDGTQYLSDDLSRKQLHRDFNEQQEEAGERQISYETYRDIFNEDFNLKCGKKRQDTCKVCDVAKSLIQRTNVAVQKQALQEFKDHHVRNATAAQESYQKDSRRDKKKYYVISADMEKILFVPKLTCGDAFFTRLLSTVNYGLHEAGTPNAYMFCWDETLAAHASEEVMSVVFLHLRSKFRRLKRGKKRTLTIWTDRAKSQCNNRFFVCFAKYLVDLGLFTKVYHKMFVTGHSYMDPDRDFALVERKYKSVRPITPDDVVDVVRRARINPDPFDVTAMQQKDFLKFKDLEEKLKFPKKLKTSNYLVYKIAASDSNLVHVKEDHITDEWTTFNLGAGRRAYTGRVPPAYTEGLLQIDLAKAKDIRKVMSCISDQEKYDYYDDLTAFASDTEDDASSGQSSDVETGEDDD